jgi:hypothetical protein
MHLEVIIEAEVVTLETEIEIDMVETTNSLSVESSKKCFHRHRKRIYNQLVVEK